MMLCNTRLANGNRCPFVPLVGSTYCCDHTVDAMRLAEEERDEARDLLRGQDARVLEARSSVTGIYACLPFATSEELDEVVVIMRSRAIRAVVAAQWITACALAVEVEREDADNRNGHNGANYAADAVAALPTPEQIVDGDAP